MANNLWSNYTEKTATPVDADEVMVRDSTDGKNKRLLFGTFWKWVAKKLNEATISELETDNKTIIGAINALNGKTSHIPVDEISVTEKTIVVTFYPKMSNGLCILRISDGQKIATVLICIGYSVRLITWANANLYTNSNCSVNGDYYSATVTIKADQITGNEQLNGSYLII